MNIREKKLEQLNNILKGKRINDTTSSVKEQFTIHQVVDYALVNGNPYLTLIAERLPSNKLFLIEYSTGLFLTTLSKPAKFGSELYKELVVTHVLQLYETAETELSESIGKVIEAGKAPYKSIRPLNEMPKEVIDIINGVVKKPHKKAAETSEGSDEKMFE